jgi:MFS family permease
MPDTIPGEFRSEANGVINTMGGIAAIVGTVGLSKLMDVSIDLPIIGNTARKLPFTISGFLVVLSTVLLFIFIKEKNREPSGKKRESVLESIRLVFSSKDRNALFILLSLLFWFFGYQGILPFLTMYTRDVIGVSVGTAGLSPGMFAIAYAIFAIPSGIVAHKFGRKRTIRGSLLMIVIICTLLFLHGPLSAAAGFSRSLTLFSFWILLFCMGAFWVSVITNSFPMLWQMATYENMGIYTGLYYTFSQTAAILSPPVTGTLIDLTGFRSIFLFGAFCMLTAAVLMGYVTKGEPGETPGK